MANSFAVNLEKMIEQSVKAEIDRIMAEETEKAKAQIERRVYDVADRLALNLLKQYRLEDMGTYVRIEVKKAT